MFVNATARGEICRNVILKLKQLPGSSYFVFKLATVKMKDVIYSAYTRASVHACGRGVCVCVRAGGRTCVYVLISRI